MERKHTKNHCIEKQACWKADETVYDGGGSRSPGAITSLGRRKVKLNLVEKVEKDRKGGKLTYVIFDDRWMHDMEMSLEENGLCLLNPLMSPNCS